MTKSHRPTNHGERATCCAAVAELASSQNLHIGIATLIATQYQSVAAAYDGARIDNDGASLKAAKATDDKGEAEGVFTRAFGAWMYSLYAQLGEAVVIRELKPLLGNRAPTRFLRTNVRVRLEHMPRLFVHVEGRRRELSGDPALLGQLRAATADLEQKVAAVEAAVRAWTATAKALVIVTASFDRTYGVLVRATLAIDPDGAGALLPVFHRVSPTIEPSPTSPTSAPAPAPAPEPEPEPEPEPADEDEHGEPDEPTAEPDDPIA